MEGEGYKYISLLTMIKSILRKLLSRKLKSLNIYG